MRRSGIIIAAILLLHVATKAQNGTAHSETYRTSAGIKIWDGAGISLKTFIKSNTAIEFNGFFNGDGSTVTTLYEFHGGLNTENNLKWYVGPGAHIRMHNNTTSPGVDGVIGLDYKFRNIPLNICLDWQPFIDFGGYGITRSAHGGIGARYTF